MICEKHGEYESKNIKVLGLDIPLGCEKCTEEQRALEKKRESEAFEREVKVLLGRRLGYSCIPVRYKDFTIEDFRKFYPSETAQAMEWLDKARQEACSLLIKGPLGTGKTTLACAILSEWCKVKTGLFTTMYKMDKQSQDDPEKFINAPLLVIDEVGRQMTTDSSDNRRFEIIDDRYAALKPTIFMGNVAEKIEVKGEIVNQFEQHLGKPLYNRIQQTLTRIVLSGQNLRLL